MEFPSTEKVLPLSSVSPEEAQISWNGDEVVVGVISKNANLQSATGLDESGLIKRLGSPWTPDEALKNCKQCNCN